MNDLKPADMDTEQKREYHREATEKYRKKWGNMDIVQVNVLVPSRLKGYFQALAKVAAAEEATMQIQDRDPDLIEALADRQVRTGIDRETLVANVEKHLEHGDDTKKLRLYKEAVNVLAVFETIGEARASTQKAKDESRHDDMYYWMAREYIASMYVKGALELFNIRESGLKLPESM